MNKKLLLILPLLLLLTACPGKYVKEPVILEDGTVATYTNWRGKDKVLTRKIKISKSVAVWEAAAKAIAALPKEQANDASSCNFLNFTPQQLVDMPSGTGQEYMRTMASCIQGKGYSGVIAKALNQPQTQAEAIMRQASISTKYIQDGATQRQGQILSFGTKGIVSIQARKTVEAGYKANTAIGVAGVENAGHTTVGNINVSNDQYATADGNTGGNGGAGSGSGEGSTGFGGTGGSGTGTATNTAPGNSQTVINIGGTTNAGIVTDDAMLQNGTENSLMTEPDSYGVLTGDGKNNIVLPCEGDETECSINDSDGGNSLF